MIFELIFFFLRGGFGFCSACSLMVSTHIYAATTFITFDCVTKLNLDRDGFLQAKLKYVAGLDVLVSNAGILISADFASVSMEEVDRSMQV